MWLPMVTFTLVWAVVHSMIAISTAATQTTKITLHVLLSLFVAGFAVLLASPVGFHWFAPECPWDRYALGLLYFVLVVLPPFLLLLPLLLRRKFRQHCERIAAIEGELPDRTGSATAPSSCCASRGCSSAQPTTLWSGARTYRPRPSGARPTPCAFCVRARWRHS